MKYIIMSVHKDDNKEIVLSSIIPTTTKFKNTLENVVSIDGQCPFNYEPTSNSPTLEVYDNDYFNTIYKVTFLDGKLSMDPDYPMIIKIEDVGSRVKMEPQPFYFNDEFQLFTGYVTPSGTFFYLKKTLPVFEAIEILRVSGNRVEPKNGQFYAGYKIHVDYDGKSPEKDDLFDVFLYKDGDYNIELLDKIPKITQIKKSEKELCPANLPGSYECERLNLHADIFIKAKAHKYCILTDDVIVFVPDIMRPTRPVWYKIEEILYYSSATERTTKIDSLIPDFVIDKKHLIAGPAKVYIKKGFFGKYIPALYSQ